MSLVDRGDIFDADLPDSGARPVLVVTRQAAIPVFSLVTVAPISSTIRRIASEVPLDSEHGLEHPSVAKLRQPHHDRQGAPRRPPRGACLPGCGPPRAPDAMSFVDLTLTVALIPVGHLYLFNKVNFSAQTMGLMTKFGSLFVATIGTWLTLAGIKRRHR
jgi:hypothetical protein